MECPIIPDGTIVLDGGDGQLYRQDNGRLRAMTVETWRALGSLPYTTYPSSMLQNCERGNPVMLDPTTPAPPTTTPAPGLEFDPTLYAIIHRDTYMDSGKVHVLTVRFGTVSVSPYAQRDLTQAFLISTDGRLRNASGSGPYLEHAEGCLLPMLRDEPTNDGVWTVTPTGEAYTYRLVSACGAALHANENSTAVDLARQTDGTSWFLVPIGRGAA
jgi:hypothetical protein